MEKKAMSANDRKLYESRSDWFVAQFEMDGCIRAAMEVIESVHVDTDTDERLQLAMYEIIAGAADVAAAVVLGMTDVAK